VYDFAVDAGGIVTPLQYPVPGSADDEVVATGIVALIHAVTGVDCADDVGSMTVTPTTAGDRFFLDTNSDLVVKDISADAGIATDLAAGQALDPDFYGVVTDGYSEAEINAAAAWCEANGKEFIGLTNDTDVVTASTTDVASDFYAAGYNRCGVL